VIAHTTPPNFIYKWGNSNSIALRYFPAKGKTSQVHIISKSRLLFFEKQKGRKNFSIRKKILIGLMILHVSFYRIYPVI
jgi:hypothetical protein